MSSDHHTYFSTACVHGHHGYCQGVDGEAGPKKPAVCKFCDAPCTCTCHGPQAVPPNPNPTWSNYQVRPQ